MKVTVAMVLALFASSTFAHNDPYFDLRPEGKTVEISTVDDQIEDQKVLPPMGEIILKTKELLVWGKKIWDIIEKNKGVTETSFVPVSVVPKVDNLTLEAMENWRGAKIVKLKFHLKNGFRMKVIEMDYKLHFYHSGSYEGKGEYIKGLTVVPYYLSVMPGFKFSAKVEALEVVNSGTKEHPVAALTLVMRMKIEAPGQTKQYSQMFQVSGDGSVKEL